MTVAATSFERDGDCAFTIPQPSNAASENNQARFVVFMNAASWVM
jgi:hypothetical protein